MLFALPPTSQKTVFPPLVNERGERHGFLLLYRRPRDHRFTVYMPNGDSYDMDSDALSRYLKRLGCKDDEVDRATGYVWNFNTALFSMEERKCLWISRDDLKRYVKSLGAEI